MKGNKKNKLLLWSVLTGVSALLLVVSTVALPITSSYESVINLTLKGESSKIVSDPNDKSDTQYFKSAFENAEKVKEHDKEVAERLSEEGCVLLKNEANALPINTSETNKAKVSVFGHSSVNMIVCGTGSADIDATGAPTLKEALESRNVDVNPSLWNFYTDTLTNGLNGNKYETNPKKGDNGIRTGEGMSGTYDVNEIPWDLYTDNAKSELSSYNDAAIVVVSRLAGEMYDLPSSTDTNGNVNESSTGNSLELTNQERAMIKGIKDSGHFNKIVVLINSTNAMECDFVDDPELGINSCLWIGYTGLVGLNAVADLLVGNESPSGRLVDTYCIDNTTAPSFVNIYGGEWSNVEDYGIKMYDRSLDSNKYFNVYQEGIYVGYRYYETRYEDYVLNQGNHGNYDYSAEVKYPFGYGKSYTTFEYSNFNVVENETSFDVSVTVQNTGDVAGKEVVQVYFQSPYTDYDKEHGIEKAAIELCGFDKTEKLEPGASEVVTINVDKKEFRAYDANGAETYIIDEGDYYLAVGTDAHDALNNVLAKKGADASRMTANGNENFAYTWEEEFDATTYSVSYDGLNSDGSANTEGYKITNQLEEADLNKVDNGNQAITYLSRSNWVDTFPTAPTSLALTEALYNEMTGIKQYTIQETDEQMPLMGQKGDLTLAQMIGKEFTDPQWDELLNQITYEEMCSMIGVGYHSTQAAPSVAKPATKDENGPQGFSGKLQDVFGLQSTMCAYTDENIMAATFNVDLMYEVGECIGEDGLALGIYGLYGPAMNTHRSPYSGRNFEYYSEDGFLGGKIAAAEVKGIQSKGIYVYIKHFAFNDQETHCRCMSIFSNEQALREVYLEPFEHAVVEGDAWNVMNSFSRVGTVWTGAHEGLMTNILRKEWGMKGFALTDFSTSGDTYDVKLGVLAGTDSWDASMSLWKDKLVKWESKQDVKLTLAMRNATKRILYTVANSAAMNGMSKTSRIVSVLPWWKSVIIGILSVSGAATIGCGAMVFLTLKKRKNENINDNVAN